MQNEKARKDDQKAMMDELRRVVKDQDELAQRIGLRGGVSTLSPGHETPRITTTPQKLDSDSQHAIQVILHRIDNEPERVPEEVTLPTLPLIHTYVSLYIRLKHLQKWLREPSRREQILTVCR
jgi:hypothetical protein